MKGNIESQLAEDFYNNTGVSLKPNGGVIGFELKAGVPLVTKNSMRLSNAVVHSVIKSENRSVVTVISDFGNIMKFPSVEDVLEHYDISEGYLEYYRWSKELNIDEAALDAQFCLRDRLEKQIELLTKSFGGIELKENHELINQDSGNQEWYTPSEIIEAARKCLGGNIKLDPFSCEQANKTVRANFYMTKDQDGWSSDWFGTVFVNHPFSRENNKRIAAKVIKEHQSGSKIVMISFAATSEAWFKPLLDYPQCFLHGRTNYYDENGNKVKGVTKGSVVTYLGDNVKAFYEAFNHLGTIKVPYKD